MLIDTHTYIHEFTQSYTHTLSHTYTQYHRHTPSHTPIHTHIYTLTHSVTHTLARAHTHAQARMYEEDHIGGLFRWEREHSVLEAGLGCVRLHLKKNDADLISQFGSFQILLLDIFRLRLGNNEVQVKDKGRGWLTTAMLNFIAASETE